MSDIIFYCSDCETRLVVDEEGAGMQLPCPVCDTQLVVPEESESAHSESETEAVAGATEIDAQWIEDKAAELLALIDGHGDGDGGEGEAVPVIREEDRGLDISFACPHCQMRLVVDSAGAGLEIECPGCENTLIIPDPLGLPEDMPVEPLVEKLLTLQKTRSGRRFTQFEARPEPMPLKPRRISVRRATSRRPVITESGLPFNESGMPSALHNGGKVQPPVSETGLTAADPSLTPAPAPAPGNLRPQRGRRKSPRKSNRGPLRFDPKEKSDLTLRLEVAPANPDEAKARRERLRQKAKRSRGHEMVPKQLAETREEHTEPSSSSQQRSGHHTGPLPPGELNPDRQDDEPLEAYPKSERAFVRKKNKHSVARVVLLTLPFLLVWLGFMSWVVALWISSPTLPAESVSQFVIPPENSVPGEYYMVSLTPLEERTLHRALQSFAQAESWQEAAQYVRDPEKMLPKMERYYANNPWQALPVDQIEIQRSGWLDGRLLILATVVTSDTYKQYYFISERVDGQYRIDWETLVEYNEMSWSRLKQEQPSEPVTMRANLTQGSYYNFQFSDAEKWACYEIRSREKGFTGIYGYVERGTETHQQLQDLLNQTSPIAVMINLRYPENAQSADLVEITEFLRSGWIVL